MKTLKVVTGLACGIVSLGLLNLGAVPQAAEEQGYGQRASKPAMSQTKSPISEQGAPESKESKQFKEASGQIATVNEEKKLLTLQQGVSAGETSEAVRQPETFSIQDDTRITDGSKSLTFADLKAGAQVKVMYEDSWLGKHVARSIQVL
ncbi:MAG: hypothetical protein HYS08_06350 [Chlamydiae bacterium]|nr:hypothetical protein [Chlamydiota bacterium]MBI3266999.1 hypothetical protein [Chlamydiota bacterium]